MDIGTIAFTPEACMPLVLNHLNVKSNCTTPETERYVVAITLAHMNASRYEIADCAHRVAAMVVARNHRLDFLCCYDELESLLIKLKEEGRRALVTIAKA